MTTFPVQPGGRISDDLSNRYSNDWLGSRPVFYNTVTQTVSSRIHDVIDYRNLEFDPEGLKNYLAFGYSVFEQTPVKNVRYLRHSARLERGDAGLPIVRYEDDAAEAMVGLTSTESEVWELLRARTHEWERSVTGDIVVPTSGGYDSRILNTLIDDRSRIRAFTYGYSDRQDESCEVVYAQEVCRRLGVRWERVQLGNYHEYFGEWDALYGCATNAHGMYQMEFYHKVLAVTGFGKYLLSGIIGDAWAGSVELSNLRSDEDVVLLGYSHGLHADPAQCHLRARHDLRAAYFEANREKLKDERWRVIESMRIKMMLLRYLIEVPAALGFSLWSPFLEQDIALSMLNLPPDRRRKRVWQAEYLKRLGLDVESLPQKLSFQNSLHYSACIQQRLAPLDKSLLAELITPQYVEWINRIVCCGWWGIKSMRLCDTLLQCGLRTPLLRNVMWRMRLHEREGQFLKAYCAYLTLKPIEQLLKRRNAA